MSTPALPAPCGEAARVPSPRLVDLDPRPLVALDWSFKEIHVTFDGVDVVRLRSFDDLLERLRVPHKIVAESTFESWDPLRRRAMVAALRDAGHEIYVFRPIHTARARGSASTAKSDANDARTIHGIASASRLHVYPLPDVDPGWVERRESVNREYQRIRLSGEKDSLVVEAVSVLGPYRLLTDDARRVLGNGTAYSPSLLAAVFFAAQHARSRDEFERLLGLHGSAYPSLLRSEVHHHSFRFARRRGVTWNVYRRELRRVFSRLKAARPTPGS